QALFQLLTVRALLTQCAELAVVFTVERVAQLEQSLGSRLVIANVTRLSEHVHQFPPTAMAKLAWRVAPMLVDDHSIGLGGDVPLDTFAEQKAGDEPLEKLTFSLLDVDIQVLRTDFACHRHLAAQPSLSDGIQGSGFHAQPLLLSARI